MSDFQTINWYPGHMAKANRLMEDELKLVDIVIELRDARMPLASANPLLEKLAKNKERLIILNKADKADPKENENWLGYFDRAILTDSINQRLTNKVVDEVKDICKDKLEKAKARGIRKKVLRAMIVGIPNVGKSTFINNIVKRKITKTENRPGVTRNLQWIRINDDLELLDTPGVLWPKLDDQNKAMKLALLGTINDDVLDKEEMVRFALDYLKCEYSGLLFDRYSIDEKKDNLVEEIGLSKKCLTSDGKVDRYKTYDMILTDIRNNKLGKISFEKYESNK